MPDPQGRHRLLEMTPMAADLILDVERRRQECGEALDQRRRSELGQFFTPSDLAAFMANLFEVTDRPARLLDPGAGVGAFEAGPAQYRALSRQSAGSCAGQYSGSGRSPAIEARIIGVAASPR